MDTLLQNRAPLQLASDPRSLELDAGPARLTHSTRTLLGADVPDTPGKRVVMLDAAIDQLLKEPSLAITNIGFEETAAKVGISRSTAYRVFEADGATPSQSFQDAIASRIVERTALGAVPEELAALPQLAEMLTAAIPHQPPEVSLIMLRNLIRTFGNAIFDAYAADPFTQLILSVQLRPIGSPALNTAIIDSIEKSRQAFITFFSAVAESFEAELRSGWTWASFSAAAGNPLAGHIINRFAIEDVSEIDLPTGVNGAPQRWTMFSTGLWGLLRITWRLPAKYTFDADEHQGKG